MAKERATPRQLSPRRVQDRLKQVERILDGDPKSGLPPKELTEDQRLEYITLFAKLAKLLADGDRMTAVKSNRSVFS